MPLRLELPFQLLIPADARLVAIRIVRKIAATGFDIVCTRPPYPTGTAEPMNYALKYKFQEPPARIELATSSLPMRCYTTKPRWRRPCHQAFRYNRFASSKKRPEACELAPRERFELPRDRPTRFPVARTTRLCDLGSQSWPINITV